MQDIDRSLEAGFGEQAALEALGALAAFAG